MSDHSFELHADARAHFMATLGFEHDLDEQAAWGAITLGSYLRDGAGWPSVATLLTCADVLIGRLASHRTAPRISVTADLEVRILSNPSPDGRVDMRAELIKTGRSMSVGETEFRSAESGDLVAVALGTFLASPRPVDVAPHGFPAIDRRDEANPSPVAPTLAEQVGVRIVRPGVSEMALRPDLLNATESLQGGLVALLGEVSAQTAASNAAASRHVVDSLDVHYLAAARVGPFRATARMLAFEPTRALVRVDVRDRGHHDRLVSVITATTRPAPPA